MTASTGGAPAPKAGLSGRTDRQRDEAKPVICQICGDQAVPGLDLGHQPISDLLVGAADLNRPETFYPLHLHHCSSCGLTQLGYIVDPAKVFKNFPFVSGTTETATRHLQSLPETLVDRLGLDHDSFALDIGSNDGTLLKGYLPYGVSFLGVDPAGDPVRIANEHGIETLHAFFNDETAEYVLQRYGQADAITAAGVFAHIDDLDGVMRGVANLLKRKGVFATDNQYWLDMVERLHYDNIFHQHLRYYSMRPLMALFDRYDMEIFHVERSDIHGGSIRVFAAWRGAHEIDPSVESLVRQEEEADLYAPTTWSRFEEAVRERRRRLFDDVYSRVVAGSRVVGIGAPAKASTVCNYCRLGPELLEYITEINPLRVGLYLPGVHIPIVDEAVMFEDRFRPDVGVLFAWNYYDEVVPKLRERGFDGEILRP